METIAKHAHIVKRHKGTSLTLPTEILENEKYRAVVYRTMEITDIKIEIIPMKDVDNALKENLCEIRVYTQGLKT